MTNEELKEEILMKEQLRASDWLCDFYDMPKERRTWRVDTLFNTIDDWLLAGLTDRVEFIMNTVDLSSLSGAEIFSLLMLCNMGHNGKCVGSGIIHNDPIKKLTGYTAFYKLVSDYWEKIQKPDREELLRGMAPK